MIYILEHRHKDYKYEWTTRGYVENKFLAKFYTRLDSLFNRDFNFRYREV